MEKGFLKPSFSIGKLSSLAPEKILEPSVHSEEEVLEDGEEIDGGVRLMYLSNEGDIEGIKELLDSGIDANYRDIDDRTALHVASCQGLKDVVELLLDREAEVDPKDRWGSTVIIRNQTIHFGVCSEMIIMYLPFFLKTASCRCDILQEH